LQSPSGGNIKAPPQEGEYRESNIIQDGRPGNWGRILSKLPVFFEAERQRFFRPLNGSRRELVAGCLRALYQRLHSPSADQHQNLTRDALRDLLLPVVRQYQAELDPASLATGADVDELDSAGLDDPQQLTTVVVRVLLDDAWIETFPDRNGLVTAFRFTRAGKLFAEALWALDRPSRSRQRNMRGCRNALEAALSDRGDAHDIVDAFEYAEKVLDDLSEGIDYFQELVRNLMQTASLHTQWDEFVEFLDRFQRDYAKQLTADNATLNRQAIRGKLEKLRSVAPAKLARMDAQLHDIAHWAVGEFNGPTLYDWMLGRIEDIVDAACESRQPGFLKAMETYLKRVNGLALQSMMLRAGQNRHAYLTAIQRVATGTRAEQDALLARIGEHLTAAEVRVLDPASFRLRSATQRRKAVTVSMQPRPGRDSKLRAAMTRAETEVFSIPNELIAERLREDLRLFRHPLKVSSMPTGTARELISAMQAVEAARNSAAGDLVARKLPTRLANTYYSGTDYEIDFKK
jgi:hypothetical protein